jgi:hypothetical protein
LFFLLLLGIRSQKSEVRNQKSESDDSDRWAETPAFRVRVLNIKCRPACLIAGIAIQKNETDGRHTQQELNLFKTNHLSEQKRHLNNSECDLNIVECEVNSSKCEVNLSECEVNTSECEVNSSKWDITTLKRELNNQ